MGAADSLTRRALLCGAAGVAASSVVRTAIASTATPAPVSGSAPRPMPGSTPGPTPTRTSMSASTSTAWPARVLYVSHGAPIFAINDPARIAELAAWGSVLPKPTGIVAITPHYASRRLEVGATGRGVALYDLPGPFARRIPRGLDYATPPSEGLAGRVGELLSAQGPVVRGDRGGFDHTTWMPLKCLFPGADAPVLELAYPYVSEAEAFALGQKLAPLRDEGVVVFASGGMTHNLAAFDGEGPPQPPPRWSSDFDAWATEALASGEVDALLDWRRKAPGEGIAHPDDGAHFRVLLIALGTAVGRGGAPHVTFPVTGFEATMSKRSVEFR